MFSYFPFGWFCDPFSQIKKNPHLLSDDTSHESAEPSRGDVNSAGRVRLAGLPLASVLIILISRISL